MAITIIPIGLDDGMFIIMGKGTLGNDTPFDRVLPGSAPMTRMNSADALAIPSCHGVAKAIAGSLAVRAGTDHTAGNVMETLVR